MAGRKRVSGSPGLVEHEPAGGEFTTSGIKRRTTVAEWPAGEGDSVAPLDVAVLFADQKHGARLGTRTPAAQLR